MGTEKDFNEMSAEELYRLAKEREEKEIQAKYEEAKGAIDEVRKELKELKKAHGREKRAIAKKHRQEVKDLEKRQLEEVNGVQKRLDDMEMVIGVRSKPKGSRRKRKNTASVQEIMGVMQPGKDYRAKDIQEALTKSGRPPVQDLHQRLGYLRNKGEIESPERGVYRKK
ncbi:hypothetical protein [Thioalkalivibrio sp. ALE16]|uniref:hypothetical protein n=1 Tax=Thioalkalivibrio sp. ALE16 TaxID=1158172 RepID=UPI000360AC39|nr:hypothetical protein [Thioalkalivibrio sp. ALE16]